MKKIFKLVIMTLICGFLFINTVAAETGEIKRLSPSKFRYKYTFGGESYSIYCPKQILQGTNHRVYNFNISYNEQKPLYDIFTEDVITTIPKSSFEKIRKIAYYGDMKFNDTQDELYYLITNGLIIKALKPDDFFYYERENYSTSLFREVEIKLEEEIDKYFIKPSFDNKEIDLSLNENITISDSNNILSTYQLVGIEGDNISYEIIDNKISLKAIKPGITTFLLKKEYIDKDYNMKLLYEDGQKNFAITPGNFTMYTSFTVKANASKIALEIKDDNTLYSNESLNVSYGIYNQENELIYQINTNVEGIFYTDYLPYGNYYIKEINNSSAYEKNNAIYNISLMSDETKTVTILNHKKSTNEINNLDKIRRIAISFLDEEGRIIDDNINFSIINEVYQSNGKKYITLKDGDYLLKILKIPDEYILEDNTKLISVNDDMDIKIVLKHKEVGIGSEENVSIVVPDTFSFNYIFIFIGLGYVKKFSKY